MTESVWHEKIKEKLEREYLRRGYSKHSIFPEFTVIGSNYRVDFAVITDKEKICYEIGSVNTTKDRMERIFDFFDEIRHIPFHADIYDYYFIKKRND
jgi:hypothetical protein